MSDVATAERSPSEATQRATAFVEARRDEASALGVALVDDLAEPDAFVRHLVTGLEALADDEYRDGQHVVAPGLGPTIGVRSPLLAATARSLLRAGEGTSATLLLLVADRLLRQDLLELRWFAFRVLEETLPRDPERTWQLLRRAAHEAGDWITVDTLARPMALGILAEHYRWPEIEQLVYAPSPWERRLVASTVATMPFVDRDRGRSADYVRRALAVLRELIGDAAPEVQKALSWAYRSVATVDPGTTARALAHEAEIAASTHDGHRAWVIRDASSKLGEEDAAALRATLAGIRRAAGSQPTSRANDIASRFQDIALGRRGDEPPL